MINITSNIDKVIERFKIIAENAKNVDFSDALVLGVNAGKARMEVRIFNEGRDVDGNPLGAYKSKTYKKKRQKAGRQINYKDEEFTGTLRRGVVVVKVNTTRVVCAIPNDSLFNISLYQEEQLDTKIFAFSEEERQLVRDNTIEAVKQIYARVFNP